MNNESIKLVNDPLDFIIWFLFNKKSKIGITKLMKSFQLFTLFEKFQNIGKFKADQFGARDTHLDAIIYKYDDVLLNVEETKISQSIEKYDFFKVSLLNHYKEELSEKLRHFISSKENQEVFNLIKAIAYLSDKYKYNKYLRFAYTLFPELTEKSTIEPEILTVPDEIVRIETIDFLKHLPINYALEFLKNKLDIIINLSLIQQELKGNLIKVSNELLISEENTSLIKEIKEDILKIIETCELENYIIILRNFLDILVENENESLDSKEKLHLMEFLILFYYITQKDLKRYYEFWRKSRLKVIFGNEIENEYE